MFQKLNKAKILNELERNKGFIFQSVFSYAVIILNIIISLLAIRHNIKTFGSNDYGIWIICFSIFNSYIHFNLGFVNVNTFSFQDKSLLEKNKVLNSSVSSTTLHLFLFIIFIAVFYFNPSLLFKTPDEIFKFKKLILIMLPGGVCMILSLQMETILFMYSKKIILKNCIEFIRLGVLYFLFLVFIDDTTDFVFFGVFFSFLNFIILLITLYYFSKFFRRSEYKFYIPWDFFKEKVFLALSYWLSSLSVFFLGQSDSLFLGFFIKDLTLITMYNQAYRLSDTGLKFIRKINEIKTPKLYEVLRNNDLPVFKNMFNKLLIVNTSMSVLCGIGISTVGFLFLEYWIGDLIKFDYTLIIVLSFLCVSGSIHGLHIILLNLTQNRAEIIKIAIIEIIINLSLSFILVKYYGIIGLPIASIITHLSTILLIRIKRSFLLNKSNHNVNFVA